MEFFEQGHVGVMKRDLDAEGLWELELDVLERLDVRDGELGGGVFFPADDAANNDGDVDLEGSASFS